MMIGKRFLGLAGGSLAIALLWFPYAGYRDFRSRIASQVNCEDNGIGGWKQILVAFAAQNGGRVPTQQERVKLAARYRQQSTHFDLTCNTGAPFQWNDRVTQITRDDPMPLAWCGKPHGFSRIWRNVLYSDLVVRHTSEQEMGQFLTGRQIRD